MSSIYGSIYRFLLGTYINQSARTVVEKTSQKVQYKVFDQYKQKYIRKLGNRYTYRYKIFDVTTAERTYLLSLNGTRQTFQPFYDTDYSASVYCDVIFNELTYFPQSFMDLTLTFVDVDTNPAITWITEWTHLVEFGGEEVIFDSEAMTFTTNYDINEWLLQESLCPDSIMPKVVFGAYEYTFDNIQLEYEKRNMIDWEAESITGRLHRRYLTDASGNIRQESAIKITMFDISDAEYTLISRFDRQIVEYYPHASDGSSLYLAHFSVEWLTDTFDFAEIMIEPIGNSTAMSLSLTSPNGSESYKAGTDQNITWTSTGLLSTSNVKLELYKNAVLDSVIIASTPNDGSYAWAIPYAQTVGADYKIKISGVEHTSVTDLSDADFAVTTPDLNTAGKGNGTDIYIDSGIKANAITDFEIDFVWQDLTSGADVLFGARYTLSYPDRIFYIQRSTAYTYVYFGNPSTDYIRYTSSVLFTNGNRYRIKISIVGTAITVTLTDLNSDIVIRTDSDTIGTLPNYNAYVFAKNNRDTAIENYTDIKIIRFKINSEEWNFSAGSGSTTTGSLGTVLNINGTLTNFWTTV